MNVLFVHQNFPGQFRHIAPDLAQRGHRVVALGINQPDATWAGVTHIRHTPQRPEGKAWPVLWEELRTKTLRGSSAAEAMQRLKQQGFEPDVVFAHPGWGEAYFVKDVFPNARMLVYAEYYYGQPGGDSGFDPEFARPGANTLYNARIKNTHLLHALAQADGGITPTWFQRDQHPKGFRDLLQVTHDGIHTQRFKPDPTAVVHLKAAGVALRPGDEVVTYVARELEPYRGYHTFMRSLPHLLAARPQARVVIVGGDGTSYGALPPQGQTWKQVFLNEVQAQLDMSRVHFVGRLPHHVLTQLMQVSAAHIYLTYPFVLSWSLLEAMSVGCLVVGSDTAPLREVISHGQNGYLVDFFDPVALAKQVGSVLENRHQMGAIRAAARATVVDRYDLQGHCLPAWRKLILEPNNGG